MLFKKCPNCESENPESAEFCLECGEKIAPDKRPVSPPVQPPSDQPQAPAAPEPAPEEESLEEETPEPRAPSSIFGERYKVIDTIGRGRLGVVYKVFDKALERELALKSFAPEIAQNTDAFAGFSRELRTERTIVHKNIARIFELNLAKGLPFVTMEFVAGKDLRTLLAEKGGRLPVDQAVSLAKQLGKALAEIHRRGVVHLDLRPSQILLDGEGTPKIIDLGITRWLRSKGLAAAPDGDSIRYASPEQIEGRISDQRSDIFSLGAILYELVTGVSPFAAAQAEAAVETGPRRAPRNPKELNPAVKTELGLLILRCLDADREKRYQDAGELCRDLERIEDGGQAEKSQEPAPVEQEKAKPPASAEVSVPAARSPLPANGKALKKAPARSLKLPAIPRIWLLRGAAVLAVLILVAVGLRLARHSGRPAPAALRPDKIILAVLPFEDGTASKNREHLGEGLAETLISELCRLPGLGVPGVASSLSASAKGTDVRQAAAALHADYVLGGSFEWIRPNPAGQCPTFRRRGRSQGLGETVRARRQGLFPRREGDRRGGGRSP